MAVPAAPSLLGERTSHDAATRARDQSTAQGGKLRTGGRARQPRARPHRHRASGQPCASTVVPSNPAAASRASRPRRAAQAATA